MAETLALALLGNPEVRLAGQPLARLRSVKSYALLYYLAMTRRAQARTVLAGLFWGDVDEYYARRNFNRTLSDLAQFVGDHLVIERQSVAFAHHQAHWLDVALLESATATQPTAQTVATLAAAATLYRGDFLDGFYVQEAPAFEQWVLTERTRLRASVLHVLHTLADYHTAQGQLTEAMMYARRLLQLEPWREEAHRQLMLLLAQSGQRSAALAQYELCRQALRSELDVEPDAATLELVARIRTGTLDPLLRRQGEAVTSDKVTSDKVTAPVEVILSPPHLVTASPPHNLPSQRTAFVGRAAELTDLRRLLVEEADCRLLTLIGPGGMGKTRLALKAAEQISAVPADQQLFRDGIFFVPLENVRDGDELITAIIAAITAESSFPLQEAAPLADQLFHFLSTKAMLLVLDNFEHLVKAALLLSDLSVAAPKVKLLVTARESIGLQEAWFYPVAGLTIPSDSAERRQAQDEFDAVRLFAQCARRTHPGFALETERAAVVRICTLVEGMPLGIELAAAWLKVMTCTQIAQEVARGLDILTARYQNMPARQRSMRVVIDHSWALLTAEEQTALARLAIFRGQFRREAANAVTGTAFFTLATLVEKALVRLTAAGHYQLHELTRQYAEEQSSQPTQVALRDAHARYYASLLHQQKSHLFTSTFRQAWATMAVELDNIRYAWQWLIEAAGAAPRGLPTDLPLPDLLRQMVELLTAYHLYHLLWLPGQALFDHACQVLAAAGWADSSETLGGRASRRAALLRIQISAGLFHLEMGHYRTSLAQAEQLLPACREFGLEDDLFRALLLYGHTQVRRGARAEAIPAFQEALALAQSLPLPRYRAEVLIGLGMIASGEGRYADAQDYYQQGLALCQALGYRPWTARILTNLGVNYSRQEAPHQARPYFEEALKLAQEEGDQFTVMINNTNLGGVQRSLHNYQASVDYHQRSLHMAREMGEERWIATNLNGLANTYLEMAQPAAAESALREALPVGHQIDSKPDTLNSIGLLGHLFARRGQLTAAIRALLFVEQHSATLARDKAYNQPLLAELRSELPSLFEEATTWTAHQTLDDVVRWLLYGESPPN